MKKLLVLLFSVFFLSLPSVSLSETYFCYGDSGVPTVLKKQGSEFSYKTPTLDHKNLKIVFEDSQYLFLMGNFHDNGSTVIAINKISNESSTIWISPDKEESSKLYQKDCIKD